VGEGIVYKDRNGVTVAHSLEIPRLGVRRGAETARCR
jgi:hypothetical protein